MQSRAYYYTQPVNFPDIDLSAVMYHGRYLDYLDRARQSIMAEHGLTFGELLKTGVVFVVVEANLRYLRPVHFDDQMHIYSRLVGRTNKSLTFEQVMTKKAVAEDALKAPLSSLAEGIHVAVIKVVCIDMKTQRARNFPEALEALLPGSAAES